MIVNQFHSLAVPIFGSPAQRRFRLGCSARVTGADPAFKTVKRRGKPRHCDRGEEPIEDQREKMRRRAEAKSIARGCQREQSLSSSIDEPAFPSRPGITLAGCAAGEERSHGAAARAWRAPDLPRSEHLGRLTARLAYSRSGCLLCFRRGLSPFISRM